MLDTSFLPPLSQQDIECAIQLIQQAYAAPASPDDLKRLQHELFEMQKRYEAWGLIIPLLEHEDTNVQFFGAHTAQVKIARDWEQFPSQNAEGIKNVVVQLTAHAITARRSKIILRKLFVALTSLALKLVPGRLPTRWPDWIMACVTMFSGLGSPMESVHDFLAIVAEEVGSADLLGSSKLQIQQTLTDSIPMVTHAINTTLESLPVSTALEIQSAIKCFQAWITLLPTNDIIRLVPTLISLLDPTREDDSIFLVSSEALQEIVSKSALSDGSGSKTLTEPLLIWADQVGNQIVQQSVVSGVEVSSISHSLCQLLVSLGDHSTSYLALNITSRVIVTEAGGVGANKTRGHLVQTYLKLLLAYTGFPGYYGVDEEESEMTLGFWYLFQETLWTTDFSGDGGDEGDDTCTAERSNTPEQVVMARAVYFEVVKVLRRKAIFPPSGSNWTKDQLEKFQVYRRDIGDTLINAYYVLRDDMLVYYINNLAERLASIQHRSEWQAPTLHCIMSIQEAMDMEKTPYLSRLFGPDILGRLPTSGRSRIRKTMLNVIGVYSSWFATQPLNESPHTNLLLSALNYIIPALEDPNLCLHAANALRNLCDANRKALAPHISLFGELHARMDHIPDSEKSKLVQSITSIIQALQPDEEITPIEAIIQPIIQKLTSALQSSVALPDQARSMAVLHLETLSGVAKGLTRINEDVFGTDDGPVVKEELEKIQNARVDLRMIKIREDIYGILRSVVDFWSTDAGVSHALSDLFKSITCLPHDITLISLPAGPLLELVCFAVQRHLTAAWLSLATILISQLNPPPVFSSTPKISPPPEAHAVVVAALPILLECSLNFLSQPRAMVANPDIVQEFFSCMDRVAHDFTNTLYSLPPGALDTLIQCAIQALSLQERYSLVSACTFLTSLIHRSSANEELLQHRRQLLQPHGRAVVRAILEGFAAVAPRSAMPNLIEMLAALLNRSENLGGTSSPTSWMTEILFANDFVPSKATAEAKNRFIKAVVGSRSLKRIRDAAQEFTLVARGLEGSNFGVATLTM
ncbi:Armadillo-type fold [Amanita muscaria]